MPLAIYSQVNTPVDAGPCMQLVILNNFLNLDASVAASALTASEIILTNGYKNIAFSLTSSQVGTLEIQRYIDAFALIPQGSPISVATVAASPTTINIRDDKAFQSLIVTFENTSGSTATISDVILLLQSS